MSKFRFLPLVFFATFFVIGLTGCGNGNGDGNGPVTPPGGDTLVVDPPVTPPVIDTTNRTAPLAGVVFGRAFSVANAVTYSRLGVRMIDIYAVRHTPAAGRNYVGLKIQLDLGGLEIVTGRRYSISDLPSTEVVANFVNSTAVEWEEMPALRGTLEITAVSETAIEGFLYIEASVNNAVSGSFTAEVIQVAPAL